MNIVKPAPIEALKAFKVFVKNAKLLCQNLKILEKFWNIFENLNLKF